MSSPNRADEEVLVPYRGGGVRVKKKTKNLCSRSSPVNFT